MANYGPSSRILAHESVILESSCPHTLTLQTDAVLRRYRHAGSGPLISVIILQVVTVSRLDDGP